MVDVLNKKQGTIWKITDPSMLKRLKKDPENYEILPDKSKGQGPGPGKDSEMQPKGISLDKEKQPVKSGK